MKKQLDEEQIDKKLADEYDRIKWEVEHLGIYEEYPLYYPKVEEDRKDEELYNENE